MIDREKVLNVLRKRFPDATYEQVAAAANGIVGLGEEWQEMTDDDEVRAHLARACGEDCALAEAAREGAQFRVFTRASG